MQKLLEEAAFSLSLSFFICILNAWSLFTFMLHLFHHLWNNTRTVPNSKSWRFDEYTWEFSGIIIIRMRFINDVFCLAPHRKKRREREQFICNCVGIVLGNVWYDAGREMWPFITVVYNHHQHRHLDDKTFLNGLLLLQLGRDETSCYEKQFRRVTICKIKEFVFMKPLIPALSIERITLYLKNKCIRKEKCYKVSP